MADVYVAPSEIVSDPDLEQERERLTHLVKASRGDRSANAEVVEAMVTGTPVTAYCGKVWVPSRNPERYPVCETCVEQYVKQWGRRPPGV